MPSMQFLVKFYFFLACVYMQSQQCAVNEVGCAQQLINQKKIVNKIKNKNKFEKYVQTRLESQSLEQEYKRPGQCFRDFKGYVYEPIENFFYVEYQEMEEDPQYSQYKDFDILWGDGTVYKMGRTLGEAASQIDMNFFQGAFSVVTLGNRISDGETVILKFYHSDRPLIKIQREYKIQMALNDAPYTQRLIDSYQTFSEDFPYVLVYKYLSTDTLEEVQDYLDLKDIKIYFYQILQSVAYAHSKGVVHLDIKPSNIIVDETTMKINMIDWGSSEFLNSTRKLPYKGTAAYESPEVLLKQGGCYDYTSDSWMLGAVLGALLEQKDFMFDDNGEDKVGILKEIQRLQINGDWDITKFEDTMDSDGMELVFQLLQMDLKKRISPQQALKHKFFDEIRENLEQKVENDEYFM